MKDLEIFTFLSNNLTIGERPNYKTIEAFDLTQKVNFYGFDVEKDIKRKVKHNILLFILKVKHL